MKWEVGKYYRTRGGHKAIISAIVPPSPDGKTTHDCMLAGYVPGVDTWTATIWTLEGRRYVSSAESVHDLVAPWIDPPEVKIELAERATTGEPRVLVTIGERVFAYDYRGMLDGLALPRDEYTNIRPYEPAKSDA